MRTFNPSLQVEFMHKSWFDEPAVMLDYQRP